MGKAATRKRTTGKSSDPAVDYLAAFNARNMLMSEIFGMGWKLALMVLIPIFAAVQLDKKFDSSPSLTMGAFFIAVFGAGYIIYKTYVRLMDQMVLDEAKKAKTRKSIKRNKDA